MTQHRTYVPVVVVFSLLLAISAIDCNKNSENPVTPGSPATPLQPVTNLSAYSANAISVGLSWTASTDAGQGDCAGYRVKAEVSGTTVDSVLVSKSAAGCLITNLQEGIIYTFTVITEATPSSQTFQNSTGASIQWAPAKRLNTDGTVPVDVYEILSTVGGSGLQFFDNSSGFPHVFSIGVSGGHQHVIDVLLDTNSAGTIVMESAHLNPLLAGQANHTRFSTTDAFVDSLNVGQVAPPTAATYTQDLVTISPSNVATGRILYAVSNDTNYVRIFLQRDPSSGTLLWGSSPNRHVRVQLSYQGTPGVIYAKPSPHYTNTTPED